MTSNYSNIYETECAPFPPGPPFRRSDLHCAGFSPPVAAAEAPFKLKGRGWVGLGMELEMGPIGPALGAIFVEHDAQSHCVENAVDRH